MMNKILMATACIGVATAASFVAASSSDAERADYNFKTITQVMPASQIIQKLEGEGYHIHEFDREHGRYEVEMTDDAGVFFEAYVDGNTGKILRIKQDD